jgi:hypothetical protein
MAHILTFDHNHQEVAMPYYLYRVASKTEFAKIDEFPNYRDARQQARVLRADLEAGCGYNIKIVFAPNPTQAERLLSTTREAPIQGDD